MPSPFCLAFRHIPHVLFDLLVLLCCHLAKFHGGGILPDKRQAFCYSTSSSTMLFSVRAPAQPFRSHAAPPASPQRAAGLFQSQLLRPLDFCSASIRPCCPLASASFSDLRALSWRYAALFVLSTVMGIHSVWSSSVPLKCNCSCVIQRDRPF